MYNHNFDGWMFEGMKDYHRREEKRNARKGKGASKLLAGVGRALISTGKKLDEQNEVSASRQPGTNPAAWSRG